MDLVPGEQVERYVVISRTGAGRMSTAYSVQHTVLESMHTLLVPNEPNRGLLRRLVAGAKIQARLRHPGIVASTDVLEINGSPALILDHVEGPSLFDFVGSHDLEQDSIDALAGGLFDAVGALHANSIVHRHLKPQNIVIDLSGESVIPRIRDFTLARSLMVPQKRRKKPRIFGTASYMSPEQSYNSDLVGPRSDLWSLGCVLYYICTRTLAFDGATTEDTLKSVRLAQYRPLQEHDSALPERWARAIEHALVANQALRAENAEELAQIWFAGAEARPKMAAKSAPVGRVALVFTDIQGSTQLWETREQVARQSLHAHDAVMRAALHRNGGYEVKTEGDAFMIAFTNATRALRFCLEVQEKLHEHPWSDDLLSLPEARSEVDFRGLRVRMGCHVGVPEARTRGGKVDYYGPMVNRAARISGAGHGGQILASGEAWDEALSAITEEAVATDLGEFSLRGLHGAQRMVQLVPATLSGRVFKPVKAPSSSQG